jgi:hypothetical protein
VDKPPFSYVRQSSVGFSVEVLFLQRTPAAGFLSRGG